MAQVIVAATVKDFKVPATTLPGKYEVAITDSNGVVNKVEVDAPTNTFSDVVPGDYTASVQLLDSSGGPLGDKATQTFTVSPPAETTVSVPDVVTVTVS